MHLGITKREEEQRGISKVNDGDTLLSKRAIMRTWNGVRTTMIIIDGWACHIVEQLNSKVLCPDILILKLR